MWTGDPWYFYLIGPAVLFTLVLLAMAFLAFASSKLYSLLPQRWQELINKFTEEDTHS